ncbi:MAG: hypothetical protein KF703_07820 [Actinobacteria bacterium]|nr:hypothetical protein [Actinomycetota bacterium]
MTPADDGRSDFAGVTWRAEARARLYGVGIGVRVADADHLPPLLAHLPHGSILDPTGNVDRLYSALLREDRGAPAFHLYAGGRRIARHAELERVSRAFAAGARHLVAMRAQRRIFIHAGVVGWHGRAVVVPGRSMTGKTSLVAELVRAGADYYSDEYAVLDEDGSVHPFAKPLSIRTPAGRPQHLIEVEAIGGRAGTAPLRIGAVLSTRYVPGAAWRPEVGSPGAAALALFDNAIPARSRFREVTEAVTAGLDDEVRTWQGIRGDAAPVARWVLAQMAAERI